MFIKWLRFLCQYKENYDDNEDEDDDDDNDDPRNETINLVLKNGHFDCCVFGFELKNVAEKSF